jgi:hypothetical protein
MNLTMIGLGMVLGSGHLCAGLAIGWYMGKSRPAPAAPPPVNLEPFVTSVEQLRLEMAQLSRLSKNVPSPDQEFTTLVARLALSLDELHQALSNPSRVVAMPKAPNPDGESHRMGAHAVSNRRILQWFAGQQIRSPITEEGRRYPFAVQQFLAMRKGEELPEPADFELVQCHDLSPTEVRYLVDQRPKGAEVVIGLGLPQPVKFLLARVEDYRSVYMYSRVGYLVTAQFLGTVDHPPYLASFGTNVETKEAPALAH